MGGDPKKTSQGPWNPRQKRLTRKKRSSRIRNCRSPPDQAISRSQVSGERSFIIKTVGKDHSPGLQSRDGSGDNLLSRNN